MQVFGGKDIYDLNSADNNTKNLSFSLLINSNQIFAYH